MYGKQYIRPENIHDLNYSEVLNMVDEGLYQLEFRSPSQDSGAIQQGLMIWSPSDNRKEKPPESAFEIALQALFSMNLEIGAFVGLFGRPNENTVQIRSDNPNVLREYPTSYEFDKQVQVMVRWTCKETVTANRYIENGSQVQNNMAVSTAFSVELREPCYFRSLGRFCPLLRLNEKQGEKLLMIVWKENDKVAGNSEP